ncbi:hypothetical protein HRR95_006179 [Exophiala dermatitidis]|nr:hypothetical protein HRR95_006179 [Exophiala dermatitidis]
MPYTLKGRNVLVTGGSRQALTTPRSATTSNEESFAAEGSNLVVNYVSRKDRADQVAEKCRKEFGVKVVVIQADIGVAEDSIRLVKETVQQLGGLDIIINNAGWTRFANFGDINDLSHDEWNKCWSTNVMSQLVLMQEAAPIFNANPDGGVFLISSSIAVSPPGVHSWHLLSSCRGKCVVEAAWAIQLPRLPASIS